MAPFPCIATNTSPPLGGGAKKNGITVVYLARGDCCLFTFGSLARYLAVLLELHPIILALWLLSVCGLRPLL